MSNGQSSMGLFVQKHCDLNRTQDRNGWSTQLNKLSQRVTELCAKFPELGDKVNKLMYEIRNEGGDMNRRGLWTFENELSYVPYSQFSCSVGAANVYNPQHLERIKELTKNHGRPFIFTIVRAHTELLAAALSQPNFFQPLCTTESWMSDDRMVTIFASKYEAHEGK